MILRDSIRIHARPEAIARFFDEIEGHYVQWHPDHVRFRWIRGRGVATGHVFYFEEYIAGRLLKKTVVFTAVVPNRHIEFAPTFRVMRLFLPRMLFRIEPDTDGCQVVAEVHLRMGPLARRAHRKLLDAVREHMRVEGVNMKRIVEHAAAGGAAL